MHILRRTFVAAAVLWALAVPLSALAVARDYGGRPGDLLALAVYAVGGLVCHQRPERSFHLWNVQLPVCARCTGIYAGAAIALIVAGVSNPSLTTSRFGQKIRALRQTAHATDDLAAARVALIIAGVPAMLTLVYEWRTGIVPANWIRALSGLPIGMAVSSIVLSSIDIPPVRREHT